MRGKSPAFDQSLSFGHLVCDPGLSKYGDEFARDSGKTRRHTFDAPGVSTTIDEIHAKTEMRDRFKAEMWQRIAEELGIPWRAAEAMHWQLGEQDMARRAGVVPFSLSSVALETAPRGRRGSSTSTRSRREPAARMAPTLLPPVTEAESQPASYLPPAIEAPMESEQPSSPEPPKEA